MYGNTLTTEQKLALTAAERQRQQRKRAQRAEDVDGDEDTSLDAPQGQPPTRHRRLSHHHISPPLQRQQPEEQNAVQPSPPHCISDE